MSQISQFSQSNTILNKAPKTKQQYSRNVKKLKLKLAAIEQQIEEVQKKMKIFSNTSNDKMIALKLSKFCKERKMTPEMLFRFADRYRKNLVSKGIFRQTLNNLGIKLTQHQINRLEYLLDEDISGQISYQQYNAYLIAFRIKGQYTAQQQFLKNLLKKVDINSILNNKDDQNPQRKHRQLLNYQQFLKFCHRHMPHLKDKQIAAIFNILQKNNLIDVDQFIDYIKRRDQQRKKIEQKNEKRKPKKQLKETDQTKTLKGIIKAILKNRPKDSKALFHTVQFVRLQKILNKNKGQLLQLFSYIDKKRRGSFGFNQIIQFYIEKQKDNEILFTYELMGRKMFIDKEIPEDVIHRYNGGIQYKKINLQDFKKFMKKQFNVIESDAQIVFRALQKKQNTLSVKAIIDAMKLQQGQKRIVYIKPTTWKTFGKDFFRKNCITILFNPFVALRFCIHIVDQLKKAQQTYWDDFQFGPTLEDPYGTQSIGLDNMQSEQTKWVNVQTLGMKQFYKEGDNMIQFSSLCPNQTFSKVVQQLSKQDPSFLWSKQKVNYNVQKVEQSHLKHLFEGVYPLIFQTFAQYGIYVFRYFVHQKWIYVITDNKIPCNQDSKPIFSFSKQQKYSWISLIQKGYAKAKGNYQQLYAADVPDLYIYQLGRKVSVKHELKNLQQNQQKTKKWLQLTNIANESKQDRVYSYVSNSGIHNLVQNNVKTGFKTNILYQILAMLQLQDQNAQNDHKSHRLVMLKNQSQQQNLKKNQKIWNPNWNKGEDTNKYDKFESQIAEKLKEIKINSQELKNSNTFLLNYKIFRSIFDLLFLVRNISFQNMVILRKHAQFEQKFPCKYELSSRTQNKTPIKMIVTLYALKIPRQTVVQLTLKDDKNNQIDKKFSTKQFSAVEFQIQPKLQNLQIKIGNWLQGHQYVYSLTFYMLSPLFHLKELDRQLLFRNVGPYDQMHAFEINDADQKERKYIYRNYFKAAERGTGCCG